jgi:beta-1,4-mannosyltransferase
MALSPGTVVRKRLRGLRFKPGTFIWHPSYPVIPRGVSRDGVRQQLAIGNRSYLFALLGMLRPYKGIETLVEAFKRLPGGDLNLLLAGSPIDDNYAANLRRVAAGDARIRLVSRHLSEIELSNYLTAADLVVLPFHNYLHSGSMIHAISNQRPSWRATKVINGIPTRTISLRRMDTRAATAIRI